MRSLKISLLVFLLSINLLSQVPETLWTKTIGGNDYDYSFSIQHTIDYGFIICGGTASFGLGGNGYTDVWLIKTNANGDTNWTKTYGGTDSDDGFGVEQTIDQGFIIGGSTYINDPGNNDFYLIKTDANGDTLWTKTYGGVGSDLCWDVEQTSDSGFILAGRTTSFGIGSMDVYVVKTNDQGDIMWTRVIGNDNWDEAKSIQQTREGGYIIAGVTFMDNGPQEDLYIIKLNGEGDTLWTRTLGGTESDVGFSVMQTLDGGFILTGRTESFGNGGQDVYLVKTDSSGNLEWTKTFGGNGDDAGFSVQQTLDKGYIICGRTESTGTLNGDIIVIKTDSNGNEHWTKIIGGDYWESAYSIVETVDSGYVIAGNTDSFGAGNLDLWMVKLGSKILGIEFTDGNPKQYTLEQNYPNPFNPSTTIRYEIPEQSFVTIKIFDVLGNEIATLVNEEKPAGSYEVEFNIYSDVSQNLVSGVYCYKLQAGNFIQTKKMVLMK